jgi:SP family sugar porter-like MFS transporter
MTIGERMDVENGEVNGLEDLQEPFIQQDKKVSNESDHHKGVESGSIGTVLLSTFVAVCGSFEFGSCVSKYCFGLSPLSVE